MAESKSRRLIVYPKIQIIFMLFIAGFGALCSLSTALVSFLLFSPEDRDLQIAAIASLSFLAGTVILGLSLYFTNRFLGPIFRLNAEIKRALEDDYKPKPFRVRKKDYFKDLAADYTLLLEKMDAKRNKAIEDFDKEEHDKEERD